MPEHFASESTAPSAEILAVSPGKALVLAGFIDGDDPRIANKTAANRISQGTYPFPLIDLKSLGMKRRWAVRVIDVRTVLDRLAAGEQLTPYGSCFPRGQDFPAKRPGVPRGRPRLDLTAKCGGQ